MSQSRLYKISFLNQGKVYEIYARSVGASGIPGFVEIAEITFGEGSAIVVDPGEEALRREFSAVKRCHVPFHAIVRIDEVDKRGKAAIREVSGGTSGPIPFPGGTGAKVEKND
ncbi:MAG: DUF1820 family protein [Mariprofundaceae bacterium]